MWLHVPRNAPPTSGLRIAGFCSGLGMLETGAQLALSALGIESHVVVHVEREIVAAALLVALGQKTDHHAPVWDDIATFDGRRWRGVLDIAVAGLPCPSFSSAGKRGGNDDARAFGEDGSGPQGQFLRIVGECRPAVVFLENVPEWVAGGHFRRFGEELSGMGYAIEDPLFVTAESVGASHERERVFILAIAERFGGGECVARGQTGGGVAAGGTDEELADAESLDGRQGRGPGDGEGGRNAAGRSVGVCGGVVGDAEREGSGRTPPDQEVTATETWGQGTWRGGSNLPLFAPGRNDFRAWAAALRLDPFIAPAVESAFSILAHGNALSNSDALRIGGNAVVPVAAAVAFYVLWNRARAGAVNVLLSHGGDDA